MCIRDRLKGEILILSTVTIDGSLSLSEHAVSVKAASSPNMYIIFAFILILLNTT